MNIEQFTVAMLARAMWHAGFLFTEKWDRQIAELTGHVLRNRVISAAGQVGWLEICNEIPTLDKNEIRRADDPAFLKTLWLAEALYLQREPDKTNGALDYMLAPRRGQPAALCVTISDGRTVYFYKENGR